MQAQGYFDEEVLKKIEFLSTPEEFHQKMLDNPNYLNDRLMEKK